MTNQPSKHSYFTEEEIKDFTDRIPENLKWLREKMNNNSLYTTKNLKSTFYAIDTLCRDLLTLKDRLNETLYDAFVDGYKECMDKINKENGIFNEDTKK